MVRNSELVRRMGNDPLLAGHEYSFMTGLPSPRDVTIMKILLGINDGGITDDLQLLPGRSRTRRLQRFLGNMAAILVDQK